MYREIKWAPELEPPTPHKFSQGVCALSLVLLAISLFGPTIAYGGEDISQPRGWWALLFGFFGITFGCFAWFASPLLLVATGFAEGGSPRGVLCCFAGASGLALSALWVTEVMRDEAGNMAPVVGFGWGYYVWVASAVVPCIVMAGWFVCQGIICWRRGTCGDTPI